MSFGWVAIAGLVGAAASTINFNEEARKACNQTRSGSTRFSG